MNAGSSLSRYDLLCSCGKAAKLKGLGSDQLPFSFLLLFIGSPFLIRKKGQVSWLVVMDVHNLSHADLFTLILSHSFVRQQSKSVSICFNHDAVFNTLSFLCPCCSHSLERPPSLSLDKTSKPWLVILQNPIQAIRKELPCFSQIKVISPSPKPQAYLDFYCMKQDIQAHQNNSLATWH